MKFKPTFWVILVITIIATIVALVFINRNHQIVIVDIPKFSHPIPTASPSLLPATSTPFSLLPVPSTLLLPVPFTSQAPTANWDQVHNEDCEEANSLMAGQYYNNNHNDNLPAALVDDQETLLNNWEDQNLGYHLDITSAETAQMIGQVYGLQTKLLNNFTLDDIKNELGENHLVIISENGRLLGNPNYKQPGPIHHMLLIKGYDSDNLITNDSGTRNGRSYIYTFDTIDNAAADWSHEINTVDPNKKTAIAVWK